MLSRAYYSRYILVSIHGKSLTSVRTVVCLTWLIAGGHDSLRGRAGRGWGLQDRSTIESHRHVSAKDIAGETDSQA